MLVFNGGVCARYLGIYGQCAAFQTINEAQERSLLLFSLIISSLSGSLCAVRGCAISEQLSFECDLVFMYTVSGLMLSSDGFSSHASSNEGVYLQGKIFRGRCIFIIPPVIVLCAMGIFLRWHYRVTLLSPAAPYGL